MGEEAGGTGVPRLIVAAMEQDDEGIHQGKMAAVEVKDSAIPLHAARKGDVWAMFQQFDTDNSGNVDSLEVSSLCKKLGTHLTVEELEAAVGAMDADGSGEIEYEEFFAWWKSDKGIQLRRKMTRPDATQGPVAGNSLIDSIDRDVLDSLQRGKVTVVDSRTRPGDIFKLERKKIEITVSCKDLPVLDATGGNMSVFIVLRLWVKSKQWWSEFGRTEILRSRSPQFVQTFTLDYVDHNDEYSFEFDQWAKLELYQRKTQFAELSRHKLHGHAVFTLRSLYHIPVRRQVRELECGGMIIPRVMDVQVGSDRSGAVEFNISGQIRGTSGGADNQICPFIQALYLVEGYWEVFYRSEVLRNTDRPEFPAFWVVGHHAGHLLDSETFIRLEIHDFEPSGELHCLGGIESTLPKLQALCDGGEVMFEVGRIGTKSMTAPRPIKIQPLNRSTLTIRIGFFPSGEGDDKSEDEETTRERRLSDIKVKGDDIKKMGGNTHRMSFGTYGEDEKFLMELMEQQNIRETDLKEVVGAGINFIDDRRSHWEKQKPDADNEVATGMGYILDPSRKSPSKRAEMQQKRREKKKAAKGDQSPTSEPTSKHGGVVESTSVRLPRQVVRMYCLLTCWRAGRFQMPEIISPSGKPLVQSVRTLGSNAERRNPKRSKAPQMVSTSGAYDDKDSLRRKNLKKEVCYDQLSLSTL
jgi:hypothetical protein